MAHAIHIFDLDGTLAETDRANNAAYRVAAATFGRKLRVWESARVTRQALTFLIPEAGLDELNAISYVKQDLFNQFLSLTRVSPSVWQNVVSGVVNVVVSNANVSRVSSILRYHEIASSFDQVFCNPGSGNKYAFCLARLGADPCDVSVWENEVGQAALAVQAGIRPERIVLI